MRRLPQLLLVLILILLCLSPVTASGDELLVNGDFESGIEGWLNTGGQLSTTQQFIHSGQYAACFNSNDSSIKNFYQDVPVQTNASYTFSGWALKNSPDINRVFITIEFRSLEDWIKVRKESDKLSIDYPDYSFLSVTEIAPAQAVSARVSVVTVPASAGPAEVYFDGFSLEEHLPIPTPAVSPSPSPPPLPTSIPEPGQNPTAAPTPIETLTPAPTQYVTSGWPGQIVINEIMYNPDESECEWIELYNRGYTPITLSGWTITDNTGSDLISTLYLPAYSFCIVAANQNAIPLNFSGLAVYLVDGRFGNGLSNAGDRVILKDGTGLIIDAISYGDDNTVFNPCCPAIGKGHSLERRPAGFDTDQAGDFRENWQPSPGLAWDGNNPTPTQAPTIVPSPASTINQAKTPSLSPTQTSLSSATPGTETGLSPAPGQASETGATPGTPPASGIPPALPQTGDPMIWKLAIAATVIGAVLVSCGIWLRRAH